MEKFLLTQKFFLCYNALPYAVRSDCMKNLDLGKDKIGKLLLNFSIPCIISMLVGALYNIVDQIFIGNGVGYLGNAATNVVYPFTVIALALALLVGDGASALFSLYLGKKDNKSANNGVGNSIILMLIISIIITIFGYVFQEQILQIYGVVGMLYSALIADVISFVIAVLILLNDNKVVKEKVTISDDVVSKEINLILNNFVITIAREYGSGGRFVGELLANELNVKFYDKELIRLASIKSGLSENYISDNEQIKNSYNLYYNNDDKIFITESDIIKKYC